MLDGDLRARDVVHPNVIGVDSRQIAGEKNDWDAAVLELSGEFRSTIGRRAKENSIGRVFLHRGQQSLLFANRFRGVPEQNYIASISEFVFDRDDDFGKKRIGDIRDDQANGVRSLSAKTGRPAMINISEPGHGTQDSLARLLGDDWHVAQDQRDRRPGNRGVTGDISQGYARLCFPGCFVPWRLGRCHPSGNPVAGRSHIA